jgi:hypothetical protein
LARTSPGAQIICTTPKELGTKPAFMVFFLLKKKMRTLRITEKAKMLS